MLSNYTYIIIIQNVIYEVEYPNDDYVPYPKYYLIESRIMNYEKPVYTNVKQ